jgi:hypothetical protein
MTPEQQVALAHHFAALPDCALVDEKVVSAVTSMPRRTLQEARSHKTGLPYIKVGRSVKYKKSAVMEFLNGGAAA